MHVCNCPAEGVSDTAAAALYKKKKTPPVPSGRYGASCVAYNDKLWMFAGSDGGYSKHGNGGYELGYDMDELYMFDLNSLTWEHILPKGSKPAARYLHTAVVIKDAMVIFGGSDAALGDVWSFNFDSRRWTQLSKMVPKAKGGPECMYAHSAVAASDDSGFIVFGGQYVSEHALSNDVWYFNIDKRKWHNILASGPPSSRPSPRFFHGMATVPVHSLAGPVAHNMSKLGDQVTVAVFTGGSTRSPLLLCTAETWLMAVNPHTKEQLWQRLPDLPYGAYYHKLDVHGNFAYVTGGHLCSETKGNMPNYYLNHVLRLDLTLWLHDHKTSSSKSYSTELRRANLSR